MNKYKLLYLLLVLSIKAYTQEVSCQSTLSGNIICKKQNEEIDFATIYFPELNKAFTANENRHFYITELCNKKYEVKVAHVGHITLDTVITISGNTKITFNLQPIKALQEVVVETHQIKKQEIETIQRSEIKAAELDRTRGGTLGEALKNVTGVTTLQTGPSIYKPMIHGMYGNRVLILNNGVRLEGQNWGSEHAPEIDPFIATKLSVIKGAASIRYGMDAVAGVVLVEPKELPHEKLLNGEINLVGASNGRAGTGSGFLEGAFDKKLSGLSWRIQGTLKKSGAYSTPTYYLTNSALTENNYSGALAYKKKNYGVDLYYSSFNSKIGIYAGSNVGNLSDLLLLFNSPTPIVASTFSYSINRGYQTVNHQTFKALGFYNLKNIGKLTYTFARQENKRSEYGEDLSYNQAIVDANIPDAYFQLVSHTSDLILEHKSIGNVSGSIGISYITQGNVYRGLDYRALIPNFRNYGGGVFVLEKWNKRKWLVEAGLRYDYKWMRTYTEDFTTLQFRISDYSWNSYSGSLGAVYSINSSIKWNTTFSTGWRPPAPIELFARGIHQSAASYEIGDTTLQAERSYTTQTFFNFSYTRFNAEIGAYYNIINNYIYLSPLQSPVVTVSGTYPAFKYTQANVYYAGIDASFDFEFIKSLHLQSKTTVIYAYNKTADDYLIYVPANRYQNGIFYTKDSLAKLRNVFIGLSALIVTTQNHVPLNSDYVPPPKGYTLLNADIGFSIPIRQQLISVSLSANNILNTSYRDYLNRFRYYSNDLGRNFTLRLKIPFSVFKNTDAH